MLLTNQLRVAVALMLALCVSHPSIGFAQQTPQSNVVQITRVDDVIENWQSDQHLFVKGNVGASREQLEKLEDWLDENGPHWTVVLMHDAKGESYTMPDGEKFRSMDAVEYALSHRLSNQTEFNRLEHKTTGESSGAVFVLFWSNGSFPIIVRTCMIDEGLASRDGSASSTAR